MITFTMNVTVIDVTTAPQRMVLDSNPTVLKRIEGMSINRPMIYGV